MSTLTDRYVWGVLRAVPTPQRAELEPEIRALVADAVEAREAAGAEGAEAERAALVELGDPERLAAQYTDRTLYLIGPRYYPEWRRLLALLLPIVVPIVAIAAAGATYLGYMESTAEQQIVPAILGGIGTAFTAGMMMVFWFTLTFAVMERIEVKGLDKGLAWSPDRLPELPAGRRTESLAEVALAIAGLAIAATALVWLQTSKPITIDGVSYPVFNPDLWSFWLPYFLVLLALEVLRHVALYLRGGWTWTLAAVNAVLNVAFVVPALWLWSEGLLFDPGLVAAFDEMGVGAGFRPGGVVFAVVMVGITAWNTVDGFRQAYIARDARG